MISITKTYRFEAAHHLPNHKGKCARPHGHSYKVDVTISGPLKPDEGQSDAGMVMDFDDLDAIVKPLIEMLDHHDLNVLLLFRTTAENIAEWFSHRIRQELEALHSDVNLTEVTVWETEKSRATWRP